MWAQKHREAHESTRHGDTGLTTVLYMYVQVHLKKIYIVKKFIFSCTLFQKVKLSYILDSLHVK